MRLLAAAREKGGRRPFTAGQAHWNAVTSRLEELPDYEEWRQQGASLTLEEATNLALSAIRQPR